MVVLVQQISEEEVEDPDPYMLLAKEESQKSPMRFQLGCVLVSKGKMICKGYNSYKTHPTYGNNNGWNFIHAEMAALYDAVKKKIPVNGAILYVYRRHRQLSKPCPHCLGMLKKFGIKKVIHT